MTSGTTGTNGTEFRARDKGVSHEEHHGGRGSYRACGSPVDPWSYLTHFGPTPSRVTWTNDPKLRSNRDEDSVHSNSGPSLVESTLSTDLTNLGRLSSCRKVAPEVR